MHLRRIEFIRTQGTERDDLLLRGNIRDPATRRPSTLLSTGFSGLHQILASPMLFDQDFSHDAPPSEESISILPQSHPSSCIDPFGASFRNALSDARRACQPIAKICLEAFE